VADEVRADEAGATGHEIGGHLRVPQRWITGR
jgi:hypothetical protein